MRILCALILLIAIPARADEVMNLFPSQRTAHQDKIDTNAQNYLERGQDFIDNLYNNHGETSFVSDADLPAMENTDTNPLPPSIGDAPSLSIDTSQTPSETQ